MANGRKLWILGGIIGLIVIVAVMWKQTSGVSGEQKREQQPEIVATEVTTIHIETGGSTPEKINVLPNESVVWVNNVTEPVIITDGNGYFSSGLIAPGDNFSYEFPVEGVFTVTTTGQAQIGVQVITVQEKEQKNAK